MTSPRVQWFAVLYWRTWHIAQRGRATRPERAVWMEKNGDFICEIGEELKFVKLDLPLAIEARLPAQRRGRRTRAELRSKLINS